jgi:hypothetical protein
MSKQTLTEKNRKLDQESAELRKQLKDAWGDPWDKASAERQKEREK